MFFLMCSFKKNSSSQSLGKAQTAAVKRDAEIGVAQVHFLLQTNLFVLNWGHWGVLSQNVLFLSKTFHCLVEVKLFVAYPLNKQSVLHLQIFAWYSLWRESRYLGRQDSPDLPFVETQSQIESENLNMGISPQRSFLVMYFMGSWDLSQTIHQIELSNTSNREIEVVKTPCWVQGLDFIARVFIFKDFGITVDLYPNSAEYNKTIC